MNIEKKGDRDRDGERGCLNFQQINNNLSDFNCHGPLTINYIQT